MCEIKIYPAGTVFYTAISYAKFDLPLQKFTNNYIKTVLTDNAQSNTKGNWANSLYLSIGNDNVSQGYLVPYEDPRDGTLSKNTVFIFKLVLIKELSYIDCKIADYKDGCVGNGEVIGKELFEHIIKEQINNNFMTKLGEKGYAFECYHDDSGNRESIIPSNLISNHFIVVSYQKFDIKENGDIVSESCIIDIEQE